MGHVPCTFFFFFNDTATTEIYTLSLHDALPISQGGDVEPGLCGDGPDSVRRGRLVRPLQDPIDVDDPALPNRRERDRKSTRLNSSHDQISYAVFCLKKKKHSSIYPLHFVALPFA